MSSQSLLIIFSYRPQVRVQDTLLEDHVWTEIERVPVFAGRYFAENAAAAHLEDWATGVLTWTV